MCKIVGESKLFGWWNVQYHRWKSLIMNFELCFLEGMCVPCSFYVALTEHFKI